VEVRKAEVAEKLLKKPRFKISLRIKCAGCAKVVDVEHDVATGLVESVADCPHCTVGFKYTVPYQKVETAKRMRSAEWNRSRPEVLELELEKAKKRQAAEAVCQSTKKRPSPVGLDEDAEAPKKRTKREVDSSAQKSCKKTCGGQAETSNSSVKTLEAPSLPLGKGTEGSKPASQEVEEKALVKRALRERPKKEQTTKTKAKTKQGHRNDPFPEGERQCRWGCGVTRLTMNRLSSHESNCAANPRHPGPKAKRIDVVD